VSILLLKRLLFPVLCIVFIYAFYTTINEMNPIASNYPKGIIIVLAVLLFWTLIVEIISFKKETGDKSKTPKSLVALIKEWKKPLLTLLILLIYANLISKLGFYVSSFFFLLILFITLGLRKVKVILFNLVLLLLLSYTLFDFFLQLNLPKGIFF
jgi:hypothetical protein